MLFFNVKHKENFTYILFYIAEHAVKDPYYFAGIVSLNESYFPICEMHTSLHDSATIANFLINFRSKYMKFIGKWPCFETVVTDCSWAMIHAICLSFNKCSVDYYLQEMYEKAYGKNECQEFTTLKLCATHFFKKICEKLKERFEKKKVRNFYKSATVKLINSETFSEFFFYAQNLLTLLDSEYLNSKALKAYRNLTTKHQKFEMPSKILLNAQGDAMYKRSRFYYHFSDVTQSSKTANSKQNFLASPDFAKYLRRTWLPYCPLWSSFIGKRITNNLVESYFRHVKVDIFGNKLRNKPGRVIRDIHTDTSAKFNQHIYNFPTKQVKKVPIDPLNEIESWDSKNDSPNWFNQGSGNYMRSTFFYSAPPNNLTRHLKKSKPNLNNALSWKFLTTNIHPNKKHNHS